MAIKDYPAYQPLVGQLDSESPLRVSLRLLTLALRGDPSWAFEEKERDDYSFDFIRYVRATSSVQKEEPMHRPRLNFKDGRVRVSNGRHRLYALLDAGYTHVEAICDAKWKAVFDTLVRDEDEGDE